MKKFSFRIDPLLLAAYSLVGIGLLFVYEASSYTAQLTYGNEYHYLIKQGVGCLVGVVATVIFSKINLDFLKRFWVVGVVVSVLLLAMVFLPGVGIQNYGARRWIGFGGFSVQPSELAKFAYVLFCAKYMSQVDMSKFSRILPVVGVGGAFCLLIIAEPNMSITVCFALVMLAMLFVGGAKLSHVALLLLPMALLLPLLIVAEPYRLKRLLAFLNPWASPKGEGYQLIQSLYALGGGGWFGRGIFNGVQKYRFLPFAESDFILAVIGEETGLFGCLVVFALFGVVIYRGVQIALHADSKFNCFLAAGITAVVAVQTLVNFAVVTGSIPPTGLPLPFVSYGGTSLVVFTAAVGVLLNLSASSGGYNEIQRLRRQ